MVSHASYSGDDDFARPSLWNSSHHGSCDPADSGASAGRHLRKYSGDEPLVDVEHIRLLLRPFSESAGTQVTTLKVPLNSADANNPNKVKVVTDVEGRALY